jgi:hypothetical protein
MDNMEQGPDPESVVPEEIRQQAYTTARMRAINAHTQTSSLIENDAISSSYKKQAKESHENPAFHKLVKAEAEEITEEDKKAKKQEVAQKDKLQTETKEWSDHHQEWKRDLFEVALQNYYDKNSVDCDIPVMKLSKGKGKGKAKLEDCIKECDKMKDCIGTSFRIGYPNGNNENPHLLEKDYHKCYFIKKDGGAHKHVDGFVSAVKPAAVAKVEAQKKFNPKSWVPVPFQADQHDPVIVKGHADLSEIVQMNTETL